jgi:hypothetical protein
LIDAAAAQSSANIMLEFVEPFSEKFVTLTSDELYAFVANATATGYIQGARGAAVRRVTRCLVTATLDAEILIVSRKHDGAF